MNRLDDIIKRLFMAGYECGKKETGLQMVIASDVIEPAAKQQIKDLVLETYQEALDLHNHTGLSLTSAFKQMVDEL